MLWFSDLPVRLHFLIIVRNGFEIEFSIHREDIADEVRAVIALEGEESANEMLFSKP